MKSIEGEGSRHGDKNMFNVQWILCVKVNLYNTVLFIAYIHMKNPLRLCSTVNVGIHIEEPSE